MGQLSGFTVPCNHGIHPQGRQLTDALSELLDARGCEEV